MLNRPPGDKMEDIDKHCLMWGIFVSSPMNAAVFSWTRLLRKFALHQENQDERPTVKKLFDVTQKLIQEQRLEISGVSEISCGTTPWEKLSPVNDEEVINLSMAKVYEFSDNVLFLGKVRQFLIQTKSGKPN